MNEYEDDLREQIARGSVIVVVGAGVSMSTVDAGRRNVASWIGLLENGVARCRQADRTLDPKLLQRIFDDIHSDDDIDLLAAAEKITTRLKRFGEYGRWLQDTVGSLTVVNRDIIDALANLPVRIATTNYDGLLEEGTGHSPITWLQTEDVQRWTRHDDPGILHLHGYWKDSRSVVLGIRSYEAVIGGEAIQTMLKTMWVERTFLFIGYGRGLEDPNFGALLGWARRIFGNSSYRHYRLVRESEVADVAPTHAGDRIAILPYGKEHSDLAGYLERLNGHTPPAAIATRPAQGKTTPVATPPRAATSAGSSELPESAAPSTPSARPLNMYEVERQIFGLDDSQMTQRLRVQFRAIAYSTADRPLYSTGDLTSTQRIVLAEHVSSFYQGRRDVLKLQSFDLPPQARRLRARSMGNDPTKEYVPHGWVFLQRGDDIEQLTPTSWDGEHRYVLPDGGGRRVFIVAVYRDGRAFNTGSDQVWIEMADLCGTAERVLVWFGGKVRSVLFQNAFEFTYGEPLQFQPVLDDRITSKIASADATVGRFASLIHRYSRPDSVRKIHKEQQSWQSVIDLWEELRATESDEWWALEVRNVTGHLVVTATGESIESDAKRGRSGKPGKRKKSR